MDIHGGIPAQFLLCEPGTFRDFNQHLLHNVVSRNQAFELRKTRDTLNLKLDPDPISGYLAQSLGSGGHSPLLGSPEMNLLKLESPELERLIMAQQSENGFHVTTAHRNSNAPSLMSQLEMHSNRTEKPISPIISNDEFQFITETNQALESILPRHHFKESMEHNDTNVMVFDNFLEPLQRVPDNQEVEQSLRAKVSADPNQSQDRLTFSRSHETHDKRDRLQGASASPDSMFHETSNLNLHDSNSIYERMARAERLLDGNASINFDLGQPSMVANSYRASSTMNEEANPGISMLSMPPIDLEVQEIVKRERKKLKNRVAASKCRKKKLEREAQLEVHVQHLKEKNIELNALANALRQQAGELKQRIMEHVGAGCPASNIRC